MMKFNLYNTEWKPLIVDVVYEDAEMAAKTYWNHVEIDRGAVVSKVYSKLGKRLGSILPNNPKGN